MVPQESCSTSAGVDVTPPQPSRKTKPLLPVSRASKLSFFKTSQPARYVFPSSLKLRVNRRDHPRAAVVQTGKQEASSWVPGLVSFRVSCNGWRRHQCISSLHKAARHQEVASRHIQGCLGIRILYGMLGQFSVPQQFWR